MRSQGALFLLSPDARRRASFSPFVLILRSLCSSAALVCAVAVRASCGYVLLGTVLYLICSVCLDIHCSLASPTGKLFFINIHFLPPLASSKGIRHLCLPPSPTFLSRICFRCLFSSGPTCVCFPISEITHRYPLHSPPQRPLQVCKQIFQL